MFVMLLALEKIVPDDVPNAENIRSGPTPKPTWPPEFSTSRSPAWMSLVLWDTKRNPGSLLYDDATGPCVEPFHLAPPGSARPKSWPRMYPTKLEQSQPCCGLEG